MEKINLDEELDPLFEGYDLGQIDDIAQDIFELLADGGTPIPLSILALCRAITIVGESKDLDMACKMIDTFSEIPFMEGGEEEEVEGDF